ncbi:hypothetical protein I5U56_02050 [Stenotrophomonas maltophilia]|nr:hypothetical protein [Stenotrophomonas maltophilia]MBH1599470.1 hypothetical protein [Stenotrophomonas maltophilia]
MIEVSVADALYCSPSNLVCQPLSWWSSAAAWAQAILTVATFVGTVLYQRKQDSRRSEEDRKRAAHENARHIEQEETKQVIRYVKTKRALERLVREIDDLIAMTNICTLNFPPQAIRAQKIPVPDYLLNLEPEFPLMPPVGGRAFTAISEFEKAQRLVADGHLRTAIQPRYQKHLKISKTQCNSAIDEITTYLLSKEASQTHAAHP